MLPLALAALVIVGCASQPREDKRMPPAQDLIGQWPQGSRVAAARMLEKYGPPDDVQPRYLAWNHIGFWKRTRVAEDGLGLIEQTLAYPVSADKRRELLMAFPDEIPYPGRRGELTVRNDSEGLNFLTANLAEAIITGDMSPDEARKTYDRTLELAAAGKSAPYTQGLEFMPP